MITALLWRKPIGKCESGVAYWVAQGKQPSRNASLIKENSTETVKMLGKLEKSFLGKTLRQNL